MSDVDIEIRRAIEEVYHMVGQDFFVEYEQEGFIIPLVQGYLLNSHFFIEKGIAPVPDEWIDACLEINA